MLISSQREEQSGQEEEAVTDHDELTKKNMDWFSWQSGSLDTVSCQERVDDTHSHSLR